MASRQRPFTTMGADSPSYSELHCLSNFSFLRGASHPEELVKRAAELGYSALAITDECSVAGVVRAHVAAREHDLRLLIGAEFRLEEGLVLVALVTDREGYGNLCELITRARRRAVKGSYALSRTDFEEGLPGCLLLLADVLLPPSPATSTAARGDNVVTLPGPAAAENDCPLTAAAHWLGACFPGRAWLAFARHLAPDDAARLERLRAVGAETGLPLVAAGAVHMHRRGRRALQDVMTAIRLNTPVAEAGAALFPNGERHLRARARLAQLYPADLLAETEAVAGRCRFSLEELRYNYPDDFLPPGESPAACLRRLTEAGIAAHWPAGAPARVRGLVEHELAIIAELQYEPYFLAVHDIVRFARSRGILCQGRGSAANSAVCFCLGITAVDPSRMEMLFERFVSKERDEPPDIDVDFEHGRREEVIQYLYERYGRERAALAATVITYRTKSAIRDVGKALGLSLEQVDRLSGAFAWWDGSDTVPERVTEAGFSPDNPVILRLFRLVEALRGMPRHLSQHVGGFVITRDRLTRLVPVENAAMAERTLIEWDKDDLDALGLLKVDCLALGMLSAVRRSFDLLRRHRGRELTLANIPAEDPRVYEMVQRADVVGVFQIESRAQMAMLPRLRPRCFFDLVIEVAIVRPGPIQGRMVHPYLRRRQGMEAVTYPSEAVRAILERTLGVPIFQEQVIKLAMVAAGFSAGEADQLRRAIAAWRRKGRLEQFQERLRRGMRERGYTDEFAQQLIDQIRGFGGYGFPESHAASFALLVYVSAWLKCHEPAAFACALLNSQPMGFYAPAQIVQDARRHRVEVRPVDVTASGWDCDLEPAAEANSHDLALRLGLRMVRGLSRSGADRLAAVRAERAFHDVTDLARRAQLHRGDLEALAAAGALVTLAGDRHQARWQVAGLEETLPLFAEAPAAEPPPTLPPVSEGEALVADYASVGLTLGRHPLALLRERLRQLRYAPTARAGELVDGSFIRVAGLVVTRQRPSSAKGVVFVTLEDETGSANVVVWDRVGQRQRRELLGARLLGVTGTVQREGDVIHVVAGRLEDHTALLGRLPTRSRDFH